MIRCFIVFYHYCILGHSVLEVVSRIRPGIWRSSAPGMWGVCIPVDGALSDSIGLVSFASWYTPAGMASASFPPLYPMISDTPG